MLTREDTQALIIMRTIARSESANPHHRNHIEGQIRALMSVLKDGEPPPSIQGAYWPEFFEWAGIPYTDEDGWPDDWLMHIGFAIERGKDGDKLIHERFESQW